MFIACVASRRIAVSGQLSRFEPATESVSLKCGPCKPVQTSASNFISIHSSDTTISVTLDGKVFCDFSISLKSFRPGSLVSGYLALPTDSVTPDSLVTAKQALLLPHRTLVLRLAIGAPPTSIGKFQSFAANAQDSALDEAMLEEAVISKRVSEGVREVLRACNVALGACRTREVAVQTEPDTEFQAVRDKLEIAEIHMQRVLEARDLEIFDLTFELSKMRVDAERKLAGIEKLENCRFKEIS